MITSVRERFWSPSANLTLEDAAELTGLLAALSRSGLPPARIWHLIAQERSGVAFPAGTVAGMLDVGGSTAAGLRIAAAEVAGPGAVALGWLMITADVTERTGASSATVYDGLVHGIDAELEQAGEMAVAMAGPRATALVLALLPMAGCGLGLLMGVNTVAVLTGTAPGRICLCTGAGFWLVGRRWIARLLAKTQIGRQKRGVSRRLAHPQSGSRPAPPGRPAQDRR